jgi:hypothetical protein
VLAGGDDGDNDPVVTATGVCVGVGVGVDVGVEFACRLDGKLVDVSGTSGGSSLPISFNSIIDDIFIRLFISTSGSYSGIE